MINLIILLIISIFHISELEATTEESSPSTTNMGMIAKLALISSSDLDVYTDHYTGFILYPNIVLSSGKPDKINRDLKTVYIKTEEKQQRYKNIENANSFRSEIHGSITSFELLNKPFNEVAQIDQNPLTDSNSECNLDAPENSFETLHFRFGPNSYQEISTPVVPTSEDKCQDVPKIPDDEKQICFESSNDQQIDFHDTDIGSALINSKTKKFCGTITGVKEGGKNFWARMLDDDLRRKIRHFIETVSVRTPSTLLDQAATIKSSPPPTNKGMIADVMFFEDQIPVTRTYYHSGFVLYPNIVLSSAKPNEMKKPFTNIAIKTTRDLRTYGNGYRLEIHGSLIFIELLNQRYKQVETIHQNPLTYSDCNLDADNTFERLYLHLTTPPSSRSYSEEKSFPVKPVSADKCKDIPKIANEKLTCFESHHLLKDLHANKVEGVLINSKTRRFCGTITTDIREGGRYFWARVLDNDFASEIQNFIDSSQKMLTDASIILDVAFLDRTDLDVHTGFTLYPDIILSSRKADEMNKPFDSIMIKRNEDQENYKVQTDNNQLRSEIRGSLIFLELLKNPYRTDQKPLTDYISECNLDAPENYFEARHFRFVAPDINFNSYEEISTPVVRTSEDKCQDVPKIPDDEKQICFESSNGQRIDLHDKNIGGVLTNSRSKKFCGTITGVKEGRQNLWGRVLDDDLRNEIQHFIDTSKKTIPVNEDNLPSSTNNLKISGVLYLDQIYMYLHTGCILYPNIVLSSRRADEINKPFQYIMIKRPEHRECYKIKTDNNELRSEIHGSLIFLELLNKPIEEVEPSIIPLTNSDCNLDGGNLFECLHFKFGSPNHMDSYEEISTPVKPTSEDKCQDVPKITNDDKQICFESSNDQQIDLHDKDIGGVLRNSRTKRFCGIITGVKQGVQNLWARVLDDDLRNEIQHFIDTSKKTLTAQTTAKTHWFKRLFALHNICL